jgi:membrane protein
MNRQEFMNLIRVTFKKWQSHDASLRAAAITFFVMLPLPSFALITVAVLAQVYGQQQALQQLILQIRNVAGSSVADLVSQLLTNAQNPLTSFFGSLFAVVFALAGALGAFSVLQKSVNKVWEIKPVHLSFTESVRSKFAPFVLTGIVGFVVVVWTAFSTVFFGAAVLFLEPVFGGLTAVFLRVLQIILSFGLGTLLFAIIFKQLPEIHVEWRDVTLAAVITSVIFTVLNYLFGVYLSLFPVTTLGGTAGSLILLFLWMYLVSLFILFGAQLTRVYAAAFGSRPVKSLQQEREEKEREERVERVEIKADLELTLSPND